MEDFWFPESEFTVVGAFWFASYTPRPEQLFELAMSLFVLERIENGTNLGKFVPVFTDEDLAQKAIEKMPMPGAIEVFQFENTHLQEAFIVMLNTVGHTHIAIDPEENNVTRRPISRILEGYRKQRGL